MIVCYPLFPPKQFDGRQRILFFFLPKRQKRPPRAKCPPKRKLQASTGTRLKNCLDSPKQEVGHFLVQDQVGSCAAWQKFKNYEFLSRHARLKFQTYTAQTAHAWSLRHASHLRCVPFHTGAVTTPRRITNLDNNSRTCKMFNSKTVACATTATQE